MCFNKKVLAALALVALAVFVFAPSALWAVLPLLVFLACPLSMFLMMRTMSGGKGQCGRAGQEASAEGDDAELARLRGEVEQLRAERELLRGEDAWRDFGNPRMARMHQLMVRDNAGMARMHEEMMGPG